MSYKKRIIKSDARCAAFLLGGIGTGTVSLGSRGELRDWEIFNRPEKGNHLPYTGFYIWMKQGDSPPIAKVLEARLPGPHNLASGHASNTLAGLPRFSEAEMCAEYPFVNIDFKEEGLPIKVSLEAFTPFIPLNANDSSFPAAVLRYKVENISDKPVDVSIAGSLANAAGQSYTEWGNVKAKNPVKTELRNESGLTGLWCFSPNSQLDCTSYGTMTLVSDMKNVSAKPNWLNGGWWDGAHDFWDDFCDDGELSPASYDSPELRDKAMVNELITTGAMASKQTIESGETGTFQFILAWHFPNRVKRWETKACVECGEKVVRNHYATLFSDAWDAAQKLYKNLERLEKSSRDFHRALFSSTLPEYVIDALAANITVIRSNTCFRLEDGTFAGWEGCHDSGGCCEGSCTHVWNYAQTLAFLFPELEQTMRAVEFGLETDENGKMAFRSRRIFNPEDKFDYHAAADGQNGTIIRLYRDWKLSGNTDMVRKLWPHVAAALDYAFTNWDSDGDCVLDSQQHNTYDIEFYGPNSLVNSLFFGALKAGVEMARLMGDEDRAKKWQDALDKGSQLMDEMLWNGEYYIQKIEDVNQYRYQYGKGCLSDQVFGQFLAHVAGLGYILPEGHVKKAVSSIFKYNFRTSLADHSNVQRVYALNDEEGLLLASWPKGGRPRFPFVYADEVWTGIEYHVAAHLIYEGFIEEGLKIAKAVRDRHDGYRRNPFNEVECGHHYARSMASWALLLSLSGYKYDLTKNEIGFSPVINKEDFNCFFSTGKHWGIFRSKKDEAGKIIQEIEILYGDTDKPKLVKF